MTERRPINNITKYRKETRLYVKEIQKDISKEYRQRYREAIKNKKRDEFFQYTDIRDNLIRLIIEEEYSENGRLNNPIYIEFRTLHLGKYEGIHFHNKSEKEVEKSEEEYFCENCCLFIKKTCKYSHLKSKKHIANVSE